LKFKRYVVWFGGPLGTILRSCSFIVNLTVFEIFSKNHFSSVSIVGQEEPPFGQNFGAFSQKIANNLII